MARSGFWRCENNSTRGECNYSSRDEFPHILHFELECVFDSWIQQRTNATTTDDGTNEGSYFRVKLVSHADEARDLRDKGQYRSVVSASNNRYGVGKSDDVKIESRRVKTLASMCSGLWLELSRACAGNDDNANGENIAVPPAPSLVSSSSFILPLALYEPCLKWFRHRVKNVNLRPIPSGYVRLAQQKGWLAGHDVECSPGRENLPTPAAMPWRAARLRRCAR